MAAESFFGKIADDVQKIAIRMEEGINVLMTGGGGLPQQQKHHGVGSFSSGGDNNNYDEFDIDNIDNLSEEEIQQLLSEEMMQNSPLAGIADSVIGDIMAGQIGPSTPMEQFHAFRSAIRWTEPLVLGIIGFQLFMFGICVWASKKNRGMVPRLIILFVIGILVRSAEYINYIANQNWEYIGATQNYFDNRGIFIGIMLCGPLLLDCFMMLICFLREASQLLIQVKKQEMANKGRKKKQQKNDQQQQQQSTSSTSTSKTSGGGGGGGGGKKKKTGVSKTRKED